MKNTIKLNHANKTIEITKTFERATTIYGSHEYLMLKGAREDYPEYSVVVKTATKKSIFASLTVEQIEKYLTKKNDEKQLANLNALKDGGATEAQIRSWFVDNNKNIKDCKKKTDLIIAMVA